MERGDPAGERQGRWVWKWGGTKADRETGLSYSKLRPWLIRKAGLRQEFQRLGVTGGETIFIELNERLLAVVERVALVTKTAGRQKIKPEDVEKGWPTQPREPPPT